MSSRRRFELSFAQERIWLQDELEDRNAIAYNIPVALWLHGLVQAPLLARCFGEICRRHDALRTTFEINRDTGAPEQVIQPWKPFHLGTVEVAGADEADQDRQVRRLITQANLRPFDLMTGPLLRVMLLRLAPDRHVLSIVMHHIVSDGWSVGVLIRELARLYEAYSSDRGIAPLSDLPIQYVDYAHWQRKRMASDAMQRQLSYWREQLKAPLPTLELPARGPRPAVFSGRGAERLWSFGQHFTAVLKSFSQQQGATLFMVLLAAFKTLLYRYSRQKEILVGTPIANRTRREIEPLIGVFANTLVIRTNLSANPTFRELLRAVRQTALEAYANQDVPFEKLVEVLQPERDLSRSPLFQVMFVLQNAPMPLLEMADIEMVPLVIEGVTSKFDMTLAIMEHEGGALSGWLEYNTDLFDVSMVDQMIAHYENILRRVVANPDERISDIELLGDTERRQLLTEWNDTFVAYRAGRCLHHLFEEQQNRTADATAVVCGHEHLSYSELDRRANQLAHYLRDKGVRAEFKVGICSQRTPELIISLLGILKAGGAYVPLDAAYPAERLAYMLEHAMIQVLLTDRQSASKLPPGPHDTIGLDSDWPEIAKRSESSVGRTVESNNLSHVIYTSGSTGRPKGVAIQHRSAAVMVSWAIDLFGPERLAGVLASTSICFDLSVYEIFAPLSCGGKAILVDTVLQAGETAPAGGVTLINTVPSAMAALTRSLPRSVRTVNLAGEALKRTLVDEIYMTTSAEEVYNLYGPSEDTTYSTFALIERSETGAPVIGHPIANTRLYLLDENMNPVPVGVTADLYIGGDGLARGYLHAPDATAEKFIPDLYAGLPGQRLYSTGDKARYRSDGNVEFLGRSDHQVKVRGFRIELSEIEAVVNTHPDIEQAVVIAREDAGGDAHLIAYVVHKGGSRDQEGASAGKSTAASDSAASVSGLKEFLRLRLPYYMVPSGFLVLDRMPLTPNGKIDRRALPAGESSRQRLHEEYLGPRTELEEDLVSVFSQILSVQQVGVNDNFFELGGHSLLAAKGVSLIRDRLKLEIPLRLLFEAPTVAGLAAGISDLETRALEIRDLDGAGRISRVDPPMEQSLIARLEEVSDQDLEDLLVNYRERKKKLATRGNR